MEEKYDVAVVTAHPDDAEIGVGGIMTRLADEGMKVLLINLTDGEPTPLGDHETRMKEADDAAKILGIDRITLEETNRRLMDSFEARVALGDAFRKYHPKIVMCMGGKTIMASPDHYQAQLITEAGVFYSRLTKWEEYFKHPVHRIEKLFYFPVTSYRTGDIPKNSFLVPYDVDVLDRKIESILAYKSQFPPGKQHFIQRIKIFNQHLGAIAGMDAAELLMSPSLLKLDVMNIFKV
ncbi:MAG: PIG-L deacetylase family protein [Candidatus Hodarchaeales archaeon]|jgi:LmbE family N-acetylglucosaminyl deacetylase